MNANKDIRLVFGLCTQLALAIAVWLSATAVGASAAHGQSHPATQWTGWNPGLAQIRLKLLDAPAPELVTVESASAPVTSFIVRLRGEPDFDKVAKSFRRDKAGAMATFQAWCSRHKGLEGLVLVGASYSGELIIGLPTNDRFNRRPSDIIERFEAFDNLVYIEVDSMAHPSKGK